MAIIGTNWLQFLAPGSHLLPDVTFQVEEEGSSKEVVAHRLLLAGVSTVFRKLFYGPMKEEQELVVIKDTTFEAFTTMINFIYQTHGMNNFSMKDIVCPESLFEIFNVSERYQVTELNDKVKETIKVFPITIDNVVDAASTAKTFAVFEEVSNG